MGRKPLPCPVCGRLPDIDQCGPPFGRLGWYANCYAWEPVEHCIGGTAETRNAAVAEWNRAALTAQQKDQGDE